MHSKCSYPLWAVFPAHMFLLAHFLVQMKPGGAPSGHRATLLQSLHASGLSARLPFPSGASYLCSKVCLSLPIRAGFPIPSSKLRARGGLDWHRATGGFFHGFECLSCWISSQLCHSWSIYNSWGSIFLNEREGEGLWCPIQVFT